MYTMAAELSTMTTLDLATQISCTNYDFLEVMNLLRIERNRQSKLKLMNLAMKLETMYSRYVDEYNKRSVDTLLSEDDRYTSYTRASARYTSCDEI
jgi:hypothetical protein